MALLTPHPVLRAAAPESPFIDGWMGDDWFHNGAFRELMLGFVAMQTGDKAFAALFQWRVLARACSDGRNRRRHDHWGCGSIQCGPTEQ